MKEKFKDINFQNKTLELIAASNNVIQIYQAKGYRLTLRQLFYSLVSQNIIPNNKKTYDWLGRTITNGRLAGFIDWDAIEDRRRNVRSSRYWENLDKAISYTIDTYKLDRWKGQEYRPEVWIEKEALVGVISDTCFELSVPYLACVGYISTSEIKASAEFSGAGAITGYYLLRRS
ncbi:MAG: hypothetical protein JRF25_10865 [Deltaproteobacteria bacterium]|nr:hypothetical protein [Deltaproteobacteria bacterium]